MVRSAPFQRATEPSMNPAPAIVRANPGFPAVTELGARPEIDGCGFSTRTS